MSDDDPSKHTKPEKTSKEHPPRSKGTVAEREERRALIAILDRRGYSNKQIANKVGVSLTQVVYDLAKINKRYIESQIKERELLIAYKIQQYKDIRKEAWEAWELSKQSHVKSVKEYSAPLGVEKVEETLFGDNKPKPKRGRGRPAKAKAQPITVNNEVELPLSDPNYSPKTVNSSGFMESMRKIKEIVTVEGALPANEYLATILKTLEAERQLLGIDLEEKNEGVTLINMDWSKMILPVNLNGNDDVEALIEREESKALELENKPIRIINDNDKQGKNGKH